MAEEPERHDQEDSAERQRSETEPPGGKVRYSRRWFLVLAGSFVAGLIGVVELFRWLAGGGSSGGGVRKMNGPFPVLNVEKVPDIPAAQWTVTVDGLVEEPQHVDHIAWAALPHVEETVDFHCVEGWSVDDVHWGGVAPGALLDRARVKPEGKFITFHAQGGTYVDSLSLEQAREPQTLLADVLNGAPLPADHGGPVRLVIPTQLGYKNVKWVTRLEVTAKPVEGYWEKRGYPRDAPV